MIPCVQVDIQWSVLEVKIFKACGRSKGTIRAQMVWGEQLQCSPVAEGLPLCYLLSYGGKILAFPSHTHFSICRKAERVWFKLLYGIVLYTVHPQTFSNSNCLAILELFCTCKSSSCMVHYLTI